MTNSNAAFPLGPALVLAASLLGSCSTSLEGGPQPSTRASALANRSADHAMYTSVEYINAGKPGPLAIVLPGEFKSSNAPAAFTPTAINNIADYAELELTRANFGILERGQLGALLQELETAYTLGNPETVRTVLQRGGLATTQWMIKFDVLKVEPVAEAKKGVQLSSLLTNKSEASVWIVGMRYTIVDANTTQQVASSYFEEKMQSGLSSGAFLGVSSYQQGQLTLDSMAHRLVQRAVSDIDRKYK